MFEINIYYFAALVPVINVIIELYKKYVAKERKPWLRVIPIIACVVGACVGAGSFYLFPSFLGAESLVVAILGGFGSGLSSVGVNQIPQQLIKLNLEKKDTTPKK